MQDRSFNSFASNMIKLLLARTRALILFTSIWIYDFGPEKLSGLWRNGPWPGCLHVKKQNILQLHNAMRNKYYQMRTWYIQVKFIWSSIAIVTSPIIPRFCPPPPPPPPRHPKFCIKHFLLFLLGRL